MGCSGSKPPQDTPALSAVLTQVDEFIVVAHANIVARDQDIADLTNMTRIGKDDARAKKMKVNAIRRKNLNKVSLYRLTVQRDNLVQLIEVEAAAAAVAMLAALAAKTPVT
jgi:hypothetical protein